MRIDQRALRPWVKQFVLLSNALSGVVGEPTDAEIAAHRGLFAAGQIRHQNIEIFISHVAPSARWRASDDQAELERCLDKVLANTPDSGFNASDVHDAVLQLQPFTEGNCRLARAVATWAILREMYSEPVEATPERVRAPFPISEHRVKRTRSAALGQKPSPPFGL